MRRFANIDLVRQDLKDAMPLHEFIALADEKHTHDTGIHHSAIERVSDTLYKKHCEMPDHPEDDDGTKDSTPSFTICPQKELFYCFGCGASGDRFEYVSDIFNVDHMEAISIVAQIEGISLERYYEDVSPEEQIRENLFRENAMARDIAHEKLLHSQKAMDYLHKRGMGDDIIELFQLGYAEPMTNGKVTQFDAIPNSINLQLDRREQFNDAILFPINDAYGRMRYFQSRPFQTMTGMKYIGGNESHPLYNDNDRMFGFSVARKGLYKNGGKLIGVEGAPDCIACVQQGLVTCGFLGTVVNQITFDMLDKYRVTELTLLLDGDKAGRDKSFKIAEKYLSMKTKVRLKIATLPDPYDPEEFINKFGGDELKKIVDNAVYSIQFLIDKKWNDAVTPTQKIDFLSQVSPYMVAVTDKFQRGIMLSYIAEKMGIDPVQVEDYYATKDAEQSGSKLYSLEGEETLLGEAINNPDFMTDLTMKFKDDDWYFFKHKCLFKILKTAIFSDVESIHTTAKNMNLDNIITLDFLEHLATKHGNVDFAMKDVEDKLIRRKVRDISVRASAMSGDMSQDIILSMDKTTTDIFNVIHHRVDNEISDAHSQVKSAMDWIHEQMEHPDQMIGISFGEGFKRLDAATMGIRPKTLTVVAANQSVGKTQICENFAMSQSVDMGIPVLWFSFEMDDLTMTFRNLSILSGVPCNNIMRGNLTAEEKAMVDNAGIRLNNAPYWISTKGSDMVDALAIARRYVNKYGVKIIYVDYAQLQYTSDRKTDQRYRELGWISKGWKQFALDTGVSVVLISQLNKEALQAKTAEAEHGAGSYEIAQDADTYITLKEKDKDEIEKCGIDHGNIILNVSKNRMGEKSVLIDIFADRPIHRICETD